MSLNTKQNEQFIVLIAGGIDIPHSPLNHSSQKIIVIKKHIDISMQIDATHFDLIMLDLTENTPLTSIPGRLQRFSHTWQSELMTRIKNPLCINNKTPIIAIINPDENSPEKKQYPLEFDDWLIKPITKEQLNKTIDLWQTNSLALNYIQIILSKTKKNQRLTLTIFEKLFEELPLQLISIKDALDNNQYTLAQEVTHKLNGSASFCGLTDIQKPANALENDLLNNHTNTRQNFLIMQQQILNFTRHREFILANLGQN